MFEEMPQFFYNVILQLLKEYAYEILSHKMVNYWIFKAVTDGRTDMTNLSKYLAGGTLKMLSLF